MIEFSKDEITIIRVIVEEARQKYYARTLSNDKYSMAARDANLKRMALCKQILEKIDKH